jgi:hypothetical protein
MILLGDTLCITVNANQAAEATHRFHLSSPDEVVGQASADSSRVAKLSHGQPLGPLAGDICDIWRRCVCRHADPVRPQFLKFHFNGSKPDASGIEFSEQPIREPEWQRLPTAHEVTDLLFPTVTCHDSYYVASKERSAWALDCG